MSSLDIYWIVKERSHHQLENDSKFSLISRLKQKFLFFHFDGRFSRATHSTVSCFGVSTSSGTRSKRTLRKCYWWWPKMAPMEKNPMREVALSRLSEIWILNWDYCLYFNPVPLRPQKQTKESRDLTESSLSFVFDIYVLLPKTCTARLVYHLIICIFPWTAVTRRPAALKNESISHVTGFVRETAPRPSAYLFLSTTRDDNSSL